MKTLTNNDWGANSIEDWGAAGFETWGGHSGGILGRNTVSL